MSSGISNDVSHNTVNYCYCMCWVRLSPNLERKGQYLVLIICTLKRTQVKGTVHPIIIYSPPQRERKKIGSVHLVCHIQVSNWFEKMLIFNLLFQAKIRTDKVHDNTFRLAGTVKISAWYLRDLNCTRFSFFIYLLLFWLIILHFKTRLQFLQFLYEDGHQICLETTQFWF